MLDKMRNILRTGWTQIHVSEAGLIQGLRPFERVQATWAQLVDSYAAVPEPYKTFFEPLQAQARVFPYTLLAPSCEGFVHAGTEKLICALGREIHILERKGPGYEAQCFPVERLICVEVRNILLDSHIRITGITTQGVSTSKTIKFNAVTDYLFAPIIKTMRLGARGDMEAGLGAATEQFEGWVRLNFKFMNYARRSLLPGDRVLGAILQPEIRADLFRLFGRTFQRRLAPTHACILTGRELIVIREEERRSSDNRYGGIWDYIPLRKIESLSLQDRDGLPALSVGLPREVRIDCLFEAARRPEVENLIARFRQLQSSAFVN